MKPGTLLFDPATNRVGEFQDHSGPYAMLRPLGGGREWQADPATLRPPTDGERIGAGVRAVNHRTRAATNSPFLVADPPRPVAGCAVCTELTERRARARAEYDHSAETDTNVLLRQHQRQEHPA